MQRCRRLKVEIKDEEALLPSLGNSARPECRSKRSLSCLVSKMSRVQIPPEAPFLRAMHAIFQPSKLPKPVVRIRNQRNLYYSTIDEEKPENVRVLYSKNRLSGLMITSKLLLLSVSVIGILVSSTVFVAIPAVPRASAQIQLSREEKNWEMINHDSLGGSYNPQNVINKNNVQFLELKWVYPFPETRISGRRFSDFLGSFAQVGASAPPLVVDGVVYIAKNSRELLALRASDGSSVWNTNIGTQHNITALKAQYPHLSGPRQTFGHTHALGYYKDRNLLIPSNPACFFDAFDALTGQIAFQMDPLLMCGTFEQYSNVWHGQGVLSEYGSHPPPFVPGTNIMVFPQMGMTGTGGRASVSGWDMSDPKSPKRIWQTWLLPPKEGDPNWAIDACSNVGGNGWYFSFPDFRESGKKAVKCTDAPRDAVINDWINPLTGKVHIASTLSAIWGHYPIDPETGIVYIGTGELGPFTNATLRPGPNLFGSGVVAIEGKTGKMVWWFQTNPHDLWDWDCSWGGILGQAVGRKVLFKACKNGILYALDRATGEPVWVFDPPTLWRTAPGTNYGVDQFNNPKSTDACCRITKNDLSKPWINYPSKGQIVVNPALSGGIESDPAYDGKRVYVATYNFPSSHVIQPVREVGNQGTGGTPVRHPQNTTIYAIDANTGRVIWSFFIDKVGFRGGLMVSGGVVYAMAADGILYMVDAETGKLLSSKNFNVPTSVMPTMGATADGKMRLFLIQGGGGLLLGSPVEGNIMALGLPDKLPEQQVITKETIKGAPKEVLKEALKELPKDVLSEVAPTQETLSPISYAVVGIGVIMLVVAGVLFTRRKKV